MRRAVILAALAAWIIAAAPIAAGERSSPDSEQWVVSCQSDAREITRRYHAGDEEAVYEAAVMILQYLAYKDSPVASTLGRLQYLVCLLELPEQLRRTAAALLDRAGVI